MSERPIIVFDVNETLLDLDSIRPVFDRIFGDPAAMRLWFANLITYSEALTLAGVYVPFTDIGGAVLRMLAATRDVTISGAGAAELTDRFATMPPHPEVPGALRRLRDHGFRLFTLTDNTLAISGRQLERGGVIDLFESRFSVDETVKRIHKPGTPIQALVRGPGALDNEMVVAPRDAFLGASAVVALDDAIGRISCESIAGYPPGIPALLPGERVTAETIAYLRELAAAGARLHGASDPSFATA